jgi:hypothetical protein
VALVLCGVGSREVFGHFRLAGPTDYTHFRDGSCWLLRGITDTELSASGAAGFQGRTASGPAVHLCAGGPGLWVVVDTGIGANSG